MKELSLILGILTLLIGGSRAEQSIKELVDLMHITCELAYVSSELAVSNQEVPWYSLLESQS